MTDLKVIWEDDALRMMDSRDRYLRNVVRDEFRRDPKKDAVEYDKDDHSCITPVSDFRYVVVWRFDAATHSAVARAVVALPNIDLRKYVKLGDHNSPEDLERLKTYVQRAIETEREQTA